MHRSFRHCIFPVLKTKTLDPLSVKLKRSEESYDKVIEHPIHCKCLSPERMQKIEEKKHFVVKENDENRMLIEQ